MQLKRVGPSSHLPIAGSLFRSVVPAGSPPAHVTGLGVPVVGRPEGRAGWRIERADHRIRLAVWGALGPLAVAAETALTLLEVPFDDTPAATLARCHAALFGTDGAVAAAVEIDLDRRQLAASALGEVTVTLSADGEPVGVPNQRGVLGVGPPSAIAALRTHRVAWDDDLRLLVHTAGLTTDPDLPAKLLPTAHPVVACSTLVREHRVPGADVCVVAARVGSSPHEEPVDGMMSP